MTKDGKTLKLACIACLFIGLVTAVVGIAAGVAQAWDIDALATLICGLGITPTGAQASRLANVPSNATKVRTLSLIALVATVALCAVGYFMGRIETPQLIAFALAILAELIMVVYSHRIVKQLERV